MIVAKINLKVNVRHEKDGRAFPTSIVWEDGRQFEVDRILDVRNSAAHKCGGVGIRYTCKICGKTVELFDEDGHWFMEK